MTWIALIAGFVWFIFAEYRDAKVSTYYPLYTTGEANKFARGKDGYYSLSKSIRNTAIVAAIALGAAFLPVEGIRYGLGAVIAGLGTWIYIVVNQNAKKQRGQKARQFDILEHFTEVKDTQIKPFKDQWVFSPGSSMGGGTTFYDIRVPKIGNVDSIAERVRAATVLSEKFDRLKAKPNLWWSLDRAKV
jgi:hypothetical protein